MKYRLEWCRTCESRERVILAGRCVVCQQPPDVPPNAHDCRCKTDGDGVPVCSGQATAGSFA